MNRGIDNGKDVDARVLREIFQAVSEEEIKVQQMSLSRDREIF